jgi:hypothetical protein
MARRKKATTTTNDDDPPVEAPRRSGRARKAVKLEDATAALSGALREEDPAYQSEDEAAQSEEEDLQSEEEDETYGKKPKARRAKADKLDGIKRIRWTIKHPYVSLQLTLEVPNFKQDDLSQELLTMIFCLLDNDDVKNLVASSKKLLHAARDPHLRFRYICEHHEEEDRLFALVSHPGLCNAETVELFVTSSRCQFSRYWAQLFFQAVGGRSPQWLKQKFGSKWGRRFSASSLIALMSKSVAIFGELKMTGKTDGDKLAAWLETEGDSNGDDHATRGRRKKKVDPVKKAQELADVKDILQ